MLEGFLLGLAFWSVPAVIVWVITGAAKLRGH